MKVEVNIMTNNEIIWRESEKLMKQGILQGTGRIIKAIVLDENGNEKEINIPEVEEIHTYEGWKQLGYQVKKGEHAIAKFSIWKYVKDKKKDDEEVGKSFCFLKMSSFFKRTQVDKVGE